VTVLVGGVGQLYQGDLDLGRRAVEVLEREDLGADVVVEDLHYGAVAVAQRLEDLRPASLVLVGTAERGRPPGTLERRRVHGIDQPPSELQRAVGEAVTGYVTIDLVLEVAFALGALPARTVTIEVEPVLPGPADHLSPEAEQLLGDVVRLAGEEARRGTLLALADDLRSLRRPDVPALASLDDLLSELEEVDEQGRWGRTFTLRDRLRDRLDGDPDAVRAEDRALARALLEELGRLERGVAPRAAG
jgi:Ni,Fe-hydrogenase maturation factor